jgi:PAS domain S-box-containing protein
MFLMDVRGIILTWNKGVEQVLGYSEEKFIGKHASNIFTPEDWAADVPQCKSWADGMVVPKSSVKFFEVSQKR